MQMAPRRGDTSGYLSRERHPPRNRRLYNYLVNSRSICIVGSVVCAVLLTPSAASVARADDVRVFILAGQSNMTGTGLASELPPSLVDPQSDVRYSWRVRTSTTHASNEWGELRHFAGASPVGVSYGPELSFGRQMADAFPADDIAILKISANGTSLTNHWDPVTGDVYESMFDYADDALAQLADDGLNPIVEAFVWVQGSGDARSLDTAIAYEDNLQRLGLDRTKR